jgi:hypothetical protein
MHACRLVGRSAVSFSRSRSSSVNRSRSSSPAIENFLSLRCYAPSSAASAKTTSSRLVSSRLVSTRLVPASGRSYDADEPRPAAELDRRAMVSRRKTRSARSVPQGLSVTPRRRRRRRGLHCQSHRRCCAPAGDETGCPGVRSIQYELVTNHGIQFPVP